MSPKNRNKSSNADERAILADRVFDGRVWQSDTAVMVRDGRIVGLASPGEIPSGWAQSRVPVGVFVTAGFIDLQVNGGGGILLNHQPTADELLDYAGGNTPRSAVSGKIVSSTDAPAHLVASDEVDIVVETMGGNEPAHTLVAAALAAGKQVYDDKCAACHGATGQGNGPAAASLNPKPVNFTDKVYMQGMPVDCHFFRINEGVQRTGMPPWKALGEDVIWKLLIYERSFSGIGLGQ